MALFARFLGRTASEGAAYAFGVATGPVLAPATESIRQEAWEHYATRIPPVGVLAEGVAQGKVDPDTAAKWAKQQGYDKGPWGVLVAAAKEGPGTGYAFELWRRGLIQDGDFEGALLTAGIQDYWITQLKKLKHALLTPEQIANAIHRDLIPAKGLIVGDLPVGVGKVPQYTKYDIDALKEAAGWGVDHDHLGVMVGLVGNPMGPHEAANAEFRKIIEHDDYLLAIAQGNTRQAWAEAIFEQSRQIPTARDFLENALRGYRDLRSALEGASLHGMTEEHATMIYQNQGRPMTVRLITQALARGGKFKPEPGEIKDPYDAAIVEGNLKPAYYDLAKALRYTQPTPFAIRQLTQAGTWDQAYAEKKLLYLGWEPKDAKDVSTAWAQPTTGGADSHVTSEQTRLRTRTHTSYIAGEITKTVARNALGVAGVTGPSITRILGIWDAEKSLFRKQLTPAQVKKAYKKGSRNAATGQAWTRDEAIAALLELGYAPLVANDFLDIP